VGHTIGGDDEAPVKLIALMDLQCPACRAHHPTLTKLADTRPTDVQVIYVHFPLSYHEHARAAARVAECAAAVGAFRQWTDFVFSQQDSLGLKTWEAMTAEAGIVDAPRIASCAENETPVPRIEAGLAYGDLVGLTGTPTLLINGWRYVRNPSEARLEGDIARILDGGRL
jgi:protein-disulfide isomerase